MNSLTIMGNLGADPENKTTQAGQQYVQFGVAVNKRRGETEETFWVRVMVFNLDRFSGMIKHLKKGSSILVIGELLKPEGYIDNSGAPKASLSVMAESMHFVFSGAKKEESEEEKVHERA